MICMRLHNENSCPCQACVNFYSYLLSTICYIKNIYQYRCFQSGFRNCPSSAGCDIERYNFSVHPHQPPAARHCQPVTPHLFRSQPFKYNYTIPYNSYHSKHINYHTIYIIFNSYFLFHLQDLSFSSSKESTVQRKVCFFAIFLNQDSLLLPSS